jgi:uncharacterized protein (DUF1499 family)
MSILLIIIAALIVFIVGYFFVLGQKSKSGTPMGLVEEKLAQCSQKPNCQCSEYSEDTGHYVPPINIAGTEVSVAINKIKSVINALGGQLQSEEGDYLAFTFSSALFGFVDDVEVRIDAANNAMHLRSASRVGYSDGGVNKKRIESITAAYLKSE